MTEAQRKLEAFNLYLTRSGESLSAAEVRDLQIASANFVAAPQAFVDQMMLYPFMLKENATRFHFPVPQRPGMSSSDADFAYSAGKNDARAVWAGEAPSNGKRKFHLHEVSAQVKISSKSLAGKKTSPCEVVADR